MSRSSIVVLNDLQTGSLAGNISIKKQHPEFPSDVYISFEALDVRVLVANNAKEEQQLTLAEYLSSSNRKQLLKAFLLPAYPKEKFVYDSYKVMSQFTSSIWDSYSLSIILDHATRSECPCLCECSISFGTGHGFNCKECSNLLWGHSPGLRARQAN